MDTALHAARMQQQRWEKSLLSSHPKQWFPTDELALHQAFDQGSSLVVHDVRPPSRSEEQSDDEEQTSREARGRV